MVCFILLLLPLHLTIADQSIWVKTYSAPQWSMDEPLGFDKTVNGGFIVASTAYNASLSNIVVAVLDSGGEVVWSKLLDLHPRFPDLVFHTHSFIDGYFSVTGLYGPYRYPYVVVMDPRGLVVKTESISVSTEGNLTIATTSSQLVIIGKYGGVGRNFLAVFDKGAGFTKLYEFNPQDGVVQALMVYSAIYSQRNFIFIAATGVSRGRFNKVILSAIHLNGTISWCRLIDLNIEINGLTAFEVKDGFLVIGDVAPIGGFPRILVTKVSFSGEVESIKLFELSTAQGRIKSTGLTYGKDGKPVLIGTLFTHNWSMLFVSKMDDLFNPGDGVLLNYTRRVVLTQTLSMNGELNLLILEKNGIRSNFTIVKLQKVDQLLNIKLFNRFETKFNTVDQFNFTVSDLPLTIRESTFTKRSISVEAVRGISIESNTIYYEAPTSTKGIEGKSLGGKSLSSDLVELLKITAPIYIPLIITVVLSVLALRRVNRDLREFLSSP